MIHIKFPHIDQFRQVIRNLINSYQYKGKDESGHSRYDHAIELPTLTFIGSVKIDGTNSSICQSNNERWVQSRNQIIDIDHDNYGFAKFVETNSHIFDQIFDHLDQDFGPNPNGTYCIFGEFFGNNIQRNADISKLPDKRFAIFDVIIINSEGKTHHLNYDKISTYLNSYPNINSIYDFGYYKININLQNPELSINELIDRTLEVEKQDPVASYFSIEGHGEGIVWTNYDNLENLTRFKTKGEKSSNTITKKSKLVTIEPEQIESLNTFIDNTLSENRLNQGLQVIYPDENYTIEKIYDFMKWCVSDVMREECDTIAINKFPEKLLIQKLYQRSREYMLDIINSKIIKE